MKTGILTFPNSTSHGAALQMFALCRAVEALGHEAEIIHYQNPYMAGRPSGVALARRVLHCRKYGAFRRFEAKLRRYPARLIREAEGLNTLADRYNAVIFGSDQVWNPDITGGDLSFFGRFCGSRTRRVAYAPSFGLEALPEPFAQDTAEELRKFHALSAREAAGQQIVENLTGQRAVLTCDPIFLLTAEEWAREEVPYPIPEDGYILYYTIKSSESLRSFCRSLSGRIGLPVLEVGGNLLNPAFRRAGLFRFAPDIGPGEWLYLLRRAAYVVTNSFHGTAFSVHFRKNFFVEYSSLTNSRLEHIVTTLGLKSRVVLPGGEPSLAPVDYAQTERVLPELRAKSLDYLKQSLEETP